jgi:hypothetical protein
MSVKQITQLFILNLQFMRKTTFFLFPGIILTINALAQKDPSVINSSGGSATYNLITHEWSVGEMAGVETYKTPSLIITQGFLQPYKLTGESVELLKNDNDKIVVYPDLGKQTCYVETTFGKPGKLNYQLVDLNGKTLLKKETNLKELTSKESINMSNYPNGFYLLRVSFTNKDETISQTFKIQK